MWFYRCHNIHGTHGTANGSTNYNGVSFFLFQICKTYTITIVNTRSQYLGKERKNILGHYLFGDKIIENCASKIFQEVQLKFIVGYTNFKPHGQYTTSTRRQKIPVQEVDCKMS